MKKETLTMEIIQYDLRKQLREGLVPVGLCIGFFLLFLLFFIKMIQINEPIVFRLWLALPLFLALAVVLGMRAYKRYAALKNPVVVRDRLVRKESRYRTSRGRNEFYCLQFTSYGEYEVPGENYSWSDLYDMNDKMVFIHADCDDEFYLVLSKPHTGKILLAYNGKMFDYQPPQQ